VDIHQLAPNEPLSPELVLVFPPELRAQALAWLPAPAWRTVRPPQRAEAADPPLPEPFAPSVGQMVVARAVQLALVFATVTILVLAMSLVANATR
jgi:hypothetical protein